MRVAWAAAVEKRMSGARGQRSHRARARRRKALTLARWAPGLHISAVVEEFFASGARKDLHSSAIKGICDHWRSRFIVSSVSCQSQRTLLCLVGQPTEHRLLPDKYNADAMGAVRHPMRPHDVHASSSWKRAHRR